MRNYCRIENNRVAEIFDLDEHHPDATDLTGIFPASIDFRPAPSGCTEGWLVFDGAIVPPDYYAVRRAAEYPPATDFIDGMVKAASPDAAISATGDAQIRAYCDACMAVKERWPKPAV